MFEKPLRRQPSPHFSMFSAYKSTSSSPIDEIFQSILLLCIGNETKEELQAARCLVLSCGHLKARLIVVYRAVFGTFRGAV
jgi:hypothetical protein